MNFERAQLILVYSFSIHCEILHHCQLCVSETNQITKDVSKEKFFCTSVSVLCDL